MWRLGFVSLVMLGACKGKDEDAPGGDDDDDTAATAPPLGNVRIDGADAAAADPESGSVRMCATDDGAVVVAWTDDRDGTLAVWARHSPDGGATWPAAPVRFGDAEAIAQQPALVCAGSTVLLAWEDQREGDVARPTIYAARSTDGGATWGPAAAVASTDGTFQQLEPQLAAAGAEVAVTWYADDNGAYDVFVARSSDGGATWGPAARVDSDAPGSAWSAHPRVALRGPDEVQVAFEDRRNGVSDLFAARSDDGGASFRPEGRIDDGQGGSYSPALLVSGAEAVDVAWHDARDGDAYEVYLAHSADAGRTWAEPVRLSIGDPPGTRDAVLPRLAAGEGGVVHAVFYASSQGGYHVMHRIVTDGVPAPATTVDHAPALALARYPALAVAGADVVVAWQDDRGATGEDQGDLYYTFSEDGGATFGATDLRIDARPPGGPVATELTVALHDRHLLAAWVDAREGTSDVWFARLPLGSEVAVAP